MKQIKSFYKQQSDYFIAKIDLLEDNQGKPKTKMKVKESLLEEIGYASWFYHQLTGKKIAAVIVNDELTLDAREYTDVADEYLTSVFKQSAFSLPFKLILQQDEILILTDKYYEGIESKKRFKQVSKKSA